MRTFEFDLTFDASDMPRREFLHDLTRCFIAFIHDLHDANGLVMLFNEIVKNIHDHAVKKSGYIHLRKKDGELEFEIKDFGENEHDWDVLVENGVSTKLGNKINHGIGLAMIQDMANGLHIDLNVCTSRGFKYQGIYRFPSPSL